MLPRKLKRDAESKKSHPAQKANCGPARHGWLDLRPKITNRNPNAAIVTMLTIP
jgi:hypothetical protein